MDDKRARELKTAVEKWARVCALDEDQAADAVGWAWYLGRGTGDRLSIPTLARAAVRRVLSGRKLPGTAGRVSKANCPRRQGWDAHASNRRPFHPPTPLDRAAARELLAKLLAVAPEGLGRFLRVAIFWHGAPTHHLASALGVSEGRVSQYRRQAAALWAKLQQ